MRQRGKKKLSRPLFPQFARTRLKASRRKADKYHVTGKRTSAHRSTTQLEF